MPTNPTGSILVRRGPTTDRVAFCPLQGEIIYDTTLDRFYIGDGITFGGVGTNQRDFPNTGVMIKGTSVDSFLVAPGKTTISDPAFQFLAYDKANAIYSFTSISTSGSALTSLTVQGAGDIVATRTDVVPNITNPTFVTTGTLSLAVNRTTLFASPTFTGTVNGITKSMVGLGSVDNTSDATKSVLYATSAGSVTNAITFNSTGGAIAGTTYNGNGAITVSYATVGAIASATLASANGVATLGSDGKLLSSQIPSSLSGAVVYKGTWNASANSPTLVNGTGTAGWEYAVTTGGTVNFGAGNITFNAGDWVIYSGTVWQQIPSTTIAAAGTLTGTALNNTVVTSSLTSVGTLANLTVTNTISGSVSGSAGSVAGTNITGTTLASGVTASSLTSVGTLSTLTVTATITGSVSGSAATFTSTSQNSQFNSLGVGTAASTTTGEIRATNDITAFYSSDLKFKDNVTPIQNALSSVIAIGGDTFDWNDTYINARGGEDGYFVQRSDFGLIAQKVKAAFPLAVRTRADGSLAVNYEKLVALAFAAIVELNTTVNKLQDEINSLKK